MLRTLLRCVLIGGMPPGHFYTIWGRQSAGFVPEVDFRSFRTRTLLRCERPGPACAFGSDTGGRGRRRVPGAAPGPGNLRSSDLFEYSDPAQHSQSDAACGLVLRARAVAVDGRRAVVG